MQKRNEDGIDKLRRIWEYGYYAQVIPEETKWTFKYKYNIANC